MTVRIGLTSNNPRYQSGRECCDCWGGGGKRLICKLSRAWVKFHWSHWLWSNWIGPKLHDSADQGSVYYVWLKTVLGKRVAWESSLSLRFPYLCLTIDFSKLIFLFQPQKQSKIERKPLPFTQCQVKGSLKPISGHWIHCHSCFNFWNMGISRDHLAAQISNYVPKTGIYMSTCSFEHPTQDWGFPANVSMCKN